MKQLLVISGKGGTGKTTILGSLAHLASLEMKMVTADCDVDAPDLHLLLQPAVQETHMYRGMDLATVNPEACTGCMACMDSCRFDAIQPIRATGPLAVSSEAGTIARIISRKCEGCAVCTLVCPHDAITLSARDAGKAMISSTRFGTMAHANLFPGQESSGKLVTLVRRLARERARETSAGLVLIDGPPGTGCPVMASLTGVDLALVVTEPTVSGLHDLERLAGVIANFSVRAMVVVNKSDVNPEKAAEIIARSRELGLEPLGTLPHTTHATRAMLAGLAMTEMEDCPPDMQNGLEEIWKQIRTALELVESGNRAPDEVTTEGET